jgi:chaperone modulatory protein CbpM
MTLRYTEAEVVATVTRLTATRLQAFIAAECVIPAHREGALVFDEADLARLELLCELAEDFELDEEALGLVMSLIDQVHGLRRQLRGLAGAVEAEPEAVRTRIRARIREAPDG